MMNNNLIISHTNTSFIINYIRIKIESLFIFKKNIASIKNRTADLKLTLTIRLFRLTRYRLHYQGTCIHICYRLSSNLYTRNLGGGDF